MNRVFSAGAPATVALLFSGCFLAGAGLDSESDAGARPRVDAASDIDAGEDRTDSGVATSRDGGGGGGDAEIAPDAADAIDAASMLPDAAAGPDAGDGPVDAGGGPVDAGGGPVDAGDGPADAAADACVPSAELCNGGDDDCDGVIDEDAGCLCERRVRAGRPYLFCAMSRSWDDARAACLALGYDLAIIEDGAEDGWLVGTAVGIDTDDWWIGLNDRLTDGDYVWVDGSTCWEGGAAGMAIGYQDFRGGFPDGSGPCVEVNTDGWNDVRCAQETNYVCELPR